MMMVIKVQSRKQKLGEISTFCSEDPPRKTEGSLFAVAEAVGLAGCIS